LGEGKFGLNINLLIAQIVNFGILFFILFTFVYKPILKTLDQRRDKIEHSLAQAKEIEEKTKEMNDSIAWQLQEAKQQASDVIAEAKQIGEKSHAEILVRANKEVADMVQKAKEEIGREKDSMMKEVKEYVVKTSLYIVEKVLSEKIDSKTKEKIVMESFEDITPST
jgi:F-type H+-transporting ATPase subunit b